MSLIVKFGNFPVLNENLNKLKEDSKKLEWTDNKIYRQATNVLVEPKICFKQVNLVEKNENSLQDLKGKLSNNKEVLENIIRVYFPKYENDLKSEFQNFTKNIINEVNLERDALNNKKGALEGLYKTMTGFPNIEYNDLNMFPKMDFNNSQMNKNDNLKNLIKKYKNQFLIKHHFASLSPNQLNNLRTYLDNEEKSKSIGYDFSFLQLNSNKNNSGSSWSSGDNTGIHNNVFNSPPNSNKTNSDMFVSKLVLCEDFKAFVNNHTLSDEQVLKYVSNCKDLKSCANLYFQELYKASILNVTMIFPDNTKQLTKFEFTADPFDIFLVVYGKYPDAKEPKLYFQNKQIIINANIDKFIGSLKLPQNAQIVVKL